MVVGHAEVESASTIAPSCPRSRSGRGRNRGSGKSNKKRGVFGNQRRIVRSFDLVGASAVVDSLNASQWCQNRPDDRDLYTETKSEYLTGIEEELYDALLNETTSQLSMALLVAAEQNERAYANKADGARLRNAGHGCQVGANPDFVDGGRRRCSVQTGTCN